MPPEFAPSPIIPPLRPLLRRSLSSIRHHFLSLNIHPNPRLILLSFSPNLFNQPLSASSTPQFDMPNPNRHHHLHTQHLNNHVNSNTPSPSPTPPKPSPKLLSIFLKFIVMSLILSLFLLFLGLAAILLLLAGSFLHRRRQSPNRTSAVSLHNIHNHLPPFQYPAVDQSPAADDCSICLEYFNEGEICRVLPVCEHVFHARCVDKWLTKVPNCPICRTRVRLDEVGASDSMISDEETKFLWAIGVGR